MSGNATVYRKMIQSAGAAGGLNLPPKDGGTPQGGVISLFLLLTESILPLGRDEGGLLRRRVTAQTLSGNAFRLSQVSISTSVHTVHWGRIIPQISPGSRC